MERVIKYSLVLSVLFLLCACSVKNDNEMIISKDGNVDYNILIAFDNELVEGLNSFESNKKSSDKVIGVNDLVNENIKDSHLEGFEKEKYSDTNYTGNLYHYSVDDIDSISSSNTSEININEDSIVSKKIFNKNNDVYTANFIYNLVAKNEYENVNFENTFTVSLPAKNINNNADKVLNSGKTLVWYINNGEEKKINFSFRLYENKHAYMSIISIIFDLLIVISFVIIKSKKVT